MIKPEKEYQVQAGIILWMRSEQKIGRLMTMLFAASLEGVYKSPRVAAQAKRQGMESGEADIRLYLENGVTVHVEIKRKGGRITPNQDERHNRLRKLGHKVEVLTASTGQDGAYKMAEILIKYGVKVSDMPAKPLFMMKSSL